MIKKTKTRRLTEKSLLLERREKEIKRMRNRTNFSGKHDNEVEAQRSEKLPIKQKYQSLFTGLCRKYCTGYENSIENNRWF